MHLAQKVVLSPRDRTMGDCEVLIEADSAAIMQRAVGCSSAGRSQRWRRDLLAEVPVMVAYAAVLDAAMQAAGSIAAVVQERLGCSTHTLLGWGLHADPGMVDLWLCGS